MSGPSGGPTIVGPSGWGPGPTWTRQPAGRRISWAGLLLILFGGALLLQKLGSPVSADGLVLAAVTVGFGYAWLGVGEPWAFIPTACFAALTASAVGTDLGLLSGSGWTPLFVGVAFLVVYAFGRIGPFRHTWAVWPAAVFLLIAAADFGARIGGFPTLRQLWPVLLVLAGVLIIERGWRSARGR